MSSMFLYNTKNALNSDAFKKLGVISTLSDKIKSNASDQNQANVHEEDNPDFIWVVRDFALSKTMTP